MIASPEQLLDRARRTTGLSDFGPDGWRDGFERQCAAADAEIGDDAEAVKRVEEIFVNRLIIRLRIEAWYAERGSEADRYGIEGPLVVIGTGRSGTTAAHYLLANDPQFRVLRKWEISDPVPPPDIKTERDDPRRPRSVAANVQHIAAIDGPTEDRKIHELSFHDDGVTLGLSDYTDYWRDADHTSAFPYHERVLRMLHSRRPPHRWLLKSPDYMYYLQPLARHYPDVRFVMTHRDPASVIPSACSVIAEHTRMRLPDWTFDPADFGRKILEHLLEAARRGMAARDIIGADRFIDIGQAEIQDDSIGVAERIYALAGLDLEDGVRDAMAQWSRKNKSGARGQHKYSAEEFGLSRGQIHEAFADYLDRYGGYCGLNA
jgi:hypothetical protein